MPCYVSANPNLSAWKSMDLLTWGGSFALSSRGVKRAPWISYTYSSCFFPCGPGKISSRRLSIPLEIFGCIHNINWVRAHLGYFILWQRIRVGHTIAFVFRSFLVTSHNWREKKHGVYWSAARHCATYWKIKNLSVFFLKEFIICWGTHSHKHTNKLTIIGC